MLILRQGIRINLVIAAEVRTELEANRYIWHPPLGNLKADIVERTEEIQPRLL